MNRALQDTASEHLIQSSLIGTLYYKLRPQIVRMSIPNGGLRNATVQNKLINEGLLNGAPDLIFAMEAGRTLWLEMKTRKGVLSDEQRGVKFKLESLGHTWALARSVDEALDILSQHGLLK